MKKTLIILSAVLLFSCAKDDGGSGAATGSGSTPSSTPCGTYNGHTLYKGSQGGCYYIKSNGTKEYVDRSKCRC